MRLSYGTRSGVFYAIVTLALLAIVVKQHSVVLPDGLASQIGHNSEALCFALLLCAVIQFLRPVPGSRGAMMSWAAGAMSILIGILLLQSDLSSSIVTLNEPFIAAGVVAIYATLPRPVRLPWLYACAVALFVVVFFDTDLVLNHAETLVAIMLAPVALDVMDRQILEGPTYDRPTRRLVWCLLLAAFAVTMLLAASWAREDLSGSFRFGIDYAHRAAESYWGWVLVHLYFSYWLGRRLAHHWVVKRDKRAARAV